VEAGYGRVGEVSDRITDELATNFESTSRRISGAVFGSPTTIATAFTVWIDDIEGELAAWSSFVTALTNDGGALHHKDLLAYRTAVLEADFADLLPPRFRQRSAQFVNFN
jgi:hypothetical protein